MVDPIQLSFLDDIESQKADQKSYCLRDLGTFKDNIRSPIHNWFQYPAGYSYKFVEITFDMFGIKPGDWVYDPFSGTGTTLLCAKQQGINGYGVEAHAFVHWVADVKLYWNYDFERLYQQLESLLTRSAVYVSQAIENTSVDGIFPDLIYKCYHPEDLKALYLLREFITHEPIESHLCDFLKLALTNTLRESAAAGTGWPYVSPRKNTGNKPPKKAVAIFQRTVRKMYTDLRAVVPYATRESTILNVLGDSRQQQNLEDAQISIAITSPPYLNNYDYADRTRLETYFWGIAKSWKEITEAFRKKLMVAATTQITRNHHQVDTALNREIEQIAPEVYQTVQAAVMQLAKLRTQKGGKKDYDLMTALYFNDILPVMRETHRVLKKGGQFCLVLGDSAPYGIHIPTEELIGQLGLGLGFRNFEYTELRKRGGKWKANPQRHNIPLREGIVTLTK
ncbi:MAG TPA: DNA methyltransferase [Spirillospora sp.]|nr:DNA methyltransferase [Spirillospora sp.]